MVSLLCRNKEQNPTVVINGNDFGLWLAESKKITCESTLNTYVVQGRIFEGGLRNRDYHSLTFIKIERENIRYE